jgi:hypothetical protein
MENIKTTILIDWNNVGIVGRCHHFGGTAASIFTVDEILFS